MKKYALIILIFFILPACGQKQKPLLGGDRDKHGCLGSAGYSWCEKKHKCIRPWEEKCE
jgi:hypothetical protein